MRSNAKISSDSTASQRVITPGPDTCAAAQKQYIDSLDAQADGKQPALAWIARAHVGRERQQQRRTWQHEEQ